jgi:membrane protease YdiL (CAAX protease family)
MKHKQRTVFLIMLGLYAASAFLSYTFFLDDLVSVSGMAIPEMDYPPVVYGLANTGIVLVVYGLLGLGGYWFAGKLGLPGILNETGNWRRWFAIPLAMGVVCGLVLVLGDSLFAPHNGFGRFPHPGFPGSIFASLSAGIGEEIAFRGFVFGLWGWILNWLMKRFGGRTPALWIANVIAALVFGASHLPAVLFLTGATTISELGPIALVEILLLNGLIGLVAGERYMKDGLVAASGVHFWTDIVFHVVWGML